MDEYDYNQLDPIYQAAYDGDLPSIKQLVGEDGGLLNAQIETYRELDSIPARGTTPLIISA